MEDANSPAGPRPRRKAAKATPPTPATPPASRRRPTAAAAPTPTRITADAKPVPPTPVPANEAPAKPTAAKRTSVNNPPAKATPAKATPASPSVTKATTAKLAKPARTPTPKAATPTRQQATSAHETARALETPLTAESGNPETTAAETTAAETTAAETTAAERPEVAAFAGSTLTREAEPADIPLWARIVADPGYTPEHTAREAVRRLGPAARDWAARMRNRYPDASADGLARLATARFTRLARSHAAAAGVTGPLGALASAGVLAHAQASLVLHIAAAYGQDPTSPQRAADLLELLRVPRLTEPTRPALMDLGRLLAGYGLRQLAAKMLPFGAAVAGAVAGTRGTADVATRAMWRFRPPPR